MAKAVKKGAKKVTKRPSTDPVNRAKQLMDQHLALSEVGVKPWSVGTKPGAKSSR